MTGEDRAAGTPAPRYGKCPRCGNIRFARPDQLCHPCRIRDGTYSPVDPERAARSIDRGKWREPPDAGG